MTVMLRIFVHIFWRIFLKSYFSLNLNFRIPKIFNILAPIYIIRNCSKFCSPGMGKVLYNRQDESNFIRIVFIRVIC